MRTVDVSECVACGAPTGLTPAPLRYVHIWFNRICGGCRDALEESYLGPRGESGDRPGPPPAVLPGAPWTAAAVERATSYRLLAEEGGTINVWPENGPVTEASVWCSAPGAFHVRHGASRVVTMVRCDWWDTPPRWLEDVTPSPAKVASWLNKATAELRPVDLTRRDRHAGGRPPTRLASGRPAEAIRTRDGWAIEVGPARGRSVIETPGREGRRLVGVRTRVRFKSPEVLGLVPSGSGYDLDRLPGHMALECGCGLAWRASEATYSTAFDALTGAGLDRIELRHLQQFHR